MSGKNISFYLLAAFIAGSLLLVFIQYNSSKNIHNLSSGNQKYLEEDKVNSNISELEKNLVRIESNVSDYVSTGNAIFIQDIKTKIQRVTNGLNTLQQVNDDSSCIALIDKLDTVVHAKIDFSNLILQRLKNSGKLSAEILINNLEGKTLMDSVYQFADAIKSARHNILQNLNKSNIKNGERAEIFNYVLLALTLIAAAVLFWFIITITQRLIASEKKEKEATKLKESFLANMSHEIRTPLNAILGFTNLLQHQKLDDQSKEYVHTIEQSGENLLTILNDILDISKIEAGMLKIETLPFNIRKVVQSVLELYTAQATKKKIELKASFTDNVPEILIGDKSRLMQILSNLISNAIKFTEHGTINLQIHTLPKVKNIIQTVITISDTGIGIEQEKLTHIFNRFQQADNDITRKYGGTGLGLSIVKELIELQNGKIEVESKVGIGTTFKITIPYFCAEYENVSNYLSYNSETHFTPFTKSISILIVEDNEVNQLLLQHLLKKWNINHAIASNGKQAIEKLQSKNYDLILMDIQMPEMDGYAATQEIREKLHIKTPIIAMTAHALVSEKEKCMSKGMNDYISKPINTNHLYNLISQYTNTIYEDKTISHSLENTSTSFQYIQLGYLNELSNGNKEFEKAVTEQFLETVPETLNHIEEAIQKNDLSQIKYWAHNLKSTISIMGLTELLSTTLDTLEFITQIDDQSIAGFKSIKEICNKAVMECEAYRNTLSK